MATISHHFNGSSDPNKKAVLVTSKHRASYVPKLGKQVSREAPVHFMAQQQSNHDSTIQGPPEKVARHVQGPTMHHEPHQLRHPKPPQQDDRIYNPRHPNEKPKPCVDLGKGAKRDLAFLSGGIGTETKDVVLVLDPFVYPKWGDQSKDWKSARGCRSSGEIPGYGSQQCNSARKPDPMRSMNLSPGTDRKVPGPGQYKLPDLPGGRSTTFQPLPTASPKRGRKSPSHSEEEEEMMAGAYGAEIKTTQSSKTLRSKKERDNEDIDLDVRSLGPGSYELPSCFEPSKQWSPRGLMHGTPRKGNQGLGIDLYQASLRPGPGQYSASSSVTKRDRSMRKSSKLERFHAGKFSMVLPDAAKTTRQ